MKVTFKNVGQGDSIILEWESEGINKIGIIDCNRVKKENPVLQYLIEKNVKKIEFIIISHPHDDHYSGFKELLEHVENNDIFITWFGHTLENLEVGYWKFFELGHEATRDLDFIIKKGFSLQQKGLLARWEIIGGNSYLEIEKNFFLQSFSPSHQEIQAYKKIVKLDAVANFKEASSAANLLSTVFKLTKDDKNILLTSDAVYNTFERIENEGKINDVEFELIQAAHHGSIKNYHPVFWSNRNLKKEKKAAIISAGENLKYKHPDFDTLEQINTNNFSISCTNIVHGMTTYVELIKKSLSLDIISDTIEDDLVSGDKVFNF